MINVELLTSVLSEAHLGEAVELKGHAEYEFTHGRKPRGSGGWMFGLGSKANHVGKDGRLLHSQVFSHNGSFGAASTAAKNYARRMGHSEVHILT